MSESTLERLFEFIWAAPSPYHAVEQAGELLAETPASLTTNGGTALAALAASRIDPAKLSFRIVGAHTDSPNLRFKPHPDASAAGYRQVVVEPYGGVLLNSWLDRDLGISGRVSVRESSGEIVTRLLKIDRPLLRVPQLAIHLDRDVNNGLKLASQQMTPIWGLDEAGGGGGAGGSGGGTGGSAGDGGFQVFLAEELNVEAAAVVAWDLMTHDLTPPAVLGQHEEFYAAPRIDNLTSCFAAAEALAALAPGDLTENVVAVVVLFDYEEIGSSTATGAASPTLMHSLERTALELGASRDHFLAALGRSMCVSADGAHAVHPNYLDRHDPHHHVRLNGGPVIKQNTNQRYATDANTSAVFQEACRAAGVPFQQYSHHTDLPCGSTIGPITATQLGIDVVDVGCSQLSMHSARELGGTQDPAMLTAALKEFLRR